MHTRIATQQTTINFFPMKPFVNKPKGIKSNWLREMAGYAETLALPDHKGNYRPIEDIYRLLNSKSDAYLNRVPGIRKDKHQVHFSKVGADASITLQDLIHNGKVTVVLI